MFGNGSESGLGFQLSTSRLIDDVSGMVDTWREDALLSHIERLNSNYERLLMQAKLIEHSLQERSNEVAALQGELAMRNGQLEATQLELKSVYKRNAFQEAQRRKTMIAVQDLGRARWREQHKGSQPI